MIVVPRKRVAFFLFKTVGQLGSYVLRGTDRNHVTEKRGKGGGGSGLVEGSRHRGAICQWEVRH